MAFKPLTSKRTSSNSELEKPNESLKPQSQEEIIASTKERIFIIYDDSGSMGEGVSDGSLIKSKQTLAAEATTEYMKNCAPHVTSVEIYPLNAGALTMSKNLPLLSAQIKKIPPSGGTPLFGSLVRLIVEQPIKKFTRALIFTDGAPTDKSVLFDRPTLLAEVKALGIPVDFILIGDIPAAYLSPEQLKLKQMAEDSRGTFLICKDGKVFKEKMKFFAPLLRHLLPSIASGDDRSNS